MAPVAGLGAVDQPCVSGESSSSPSDCKRDTQAHQESRGMDARGIAYLPVPATKVTIPDRQGFSW